MSGKRIYGYAVADKDGKPAPTKRNAYDTKNAAAVGFYHMQPYNKRVKLKDQDEYRIVALVAADE